MRPLRSLTRYLAVVFLGGALLAPGLFWLAQSLAPLHPALQKIAQHPFHRFLDRSLLILALAGLWPLLRQLGANSWRDVGFTSAPSRGRELGAGFLLGFASLALAVALGLIFGGHDWNVAATGGQLLAKMSGAALTAVVVAVLEEILFRGGIFGGLRRSCDWRLALAVSSAVYALVHFLARVELPGPVTWLSGLELLPRKLQGFAELHALVPGFFSLTVAGALLALAFQRTGGIHCSIGLHAGWIFWLKSAAVLTTPVPGANQWLWGTSKLIDGWLAFAILVLTLAGAAWWWEKKSPRPVA